MTTKFNKIWGRWEDTYQKHMDMGNMLIDLVHERGCIHVRTDENFNYFLHKSVKYPDGIQLTEFWQDEDGIHMLRDDDIYEGWDLTEITFHDFEIVK